MLSDSHQQEGLGLDGLHSPVPSPLSAVASKSTFYHTLANVSYHHLPRVQCDADGSLTARKRRFLCVR